MREDGKLTSNLAESHGGAGANEGGEGVAVGGLQNAALIGRDSIRSEVKLEVRVLLENVEAVGSTGYFC